MHELASTRPSRSVSVSRRYKVTTEKHLENVDAVLSRLRYARLHLNWDKCTSMQHCIEYLDHIIDENGCHLTDEKVKAIREAPLPKDNRALLILGILNYYGKFLPNLSSNLTPLYTLLRTKQYVFFLGTDWDEAFTKGKRALQANSLFIHFDPNKPLILVCDASQHGIGAVLSHAMEDGLDIPIAYTSRTLNSAVKRYSQLEKEALAIVLGVKKFHNYIYGRHFTIQLDHQSRSFFVHKKKGIPQLASAHIQR